MRGEAEVRIRERAEQEQNGSVSSEVQWIPEQEPGDKDWKKKDDYEEEGIMYHNKYENGDPKPCQEK